MDSIRIKRGLSKGLPTNLPLGELAFCTDTQELWVGTGSSTPLKRVRDRETEQKIEETNAQLSQIPISYTSKLESLSDSDKIQQAIDEAILNKKEVFLNEKNYLIDKEINVRSDITININSGTTLRAINEMRSIFNITDCSNVVFVGNNSIFDLNEKAKSAIFSYSGPSTSVTKENLKIENIVIKNKATTDRFYSAIRIANISNVILNGITVLNFGQDNVAENECYGIGIHFAKNVDIKNYKIDTCMIGFCLERTKKITLSYFEMSNVTDNGIYELDGLEDVVWENGVIDNVEEGIVVKNDYTTVRNVVVKNATNRCISIRKGRFVKLVDCTFISSNGGVGTDNTGNHDYPEITNCNFVDYSGNSPQIQLNAICGRVTNCNFISPSVVGANHLLFINSTGWNVDNCLFDGNAGGSYIRISGNDINLTTIRNSIFKNKTSGNSIETYHATSEIKNTLVDRCIFHNISSPVGGNRWNDSNNNVIENFGKYNGVVS